MEITYSSARPGGMPVTRRISHPTPEKSRQQTAPRCLTYYISSETSVSKHHRSLEIVRADAAVAGTVGFQDTGTGRRDRLFSRCIDVLFGYNAAAMARTAFARSGSTSPGSPDALEVLRWQSSSLEFRGSILLFVSVFGENITVDVVVFHQLRRE
jgi:hypothetical protein